MVSGVCVCVCVLSCAVCAFFGVFEYVCILFGMCCVMMYGLCLCVCLCGSFNVVVCGVCGILCDAVWCVVLFVMRLLCVCVCFLSCVRGCCL